MPYATRCVIIIIATCPFVNPFCPFPKGFGHGKNAEIFSLPAPYQEVRRSLFPTARSAGRLPAPAPAIPAAWAGRHIGRPLQNSPKGGGRNVGEAISLPPRFAIIAAFSGGYYPPLHSPPRSGDHCNVTGRRGRRPLHTHTNLPVFPQGPPRVTARWVTPPLFGHRGLPHDPAPLPRLHKQNRPRKRGRFCETEHGLYRFCAAFLRAASPEGALSRLLLRPARALRNRISSSRMPCTNWE